MRIPGREKVSNGLAWLAFVMAIVGGFAATGTFIGTTIIKLIQIGPWFTALPLGIVGFFLVLKDLADDGIPDRIRTVYITILLPSTWLSIEGKLGRYLNGWIHSMNNWLDAKGGEWISNSHRGTQAIMTAIAVSAIAAALFWAHQYARKNSKKGAGANVGTNANTGTPRTTAGRTTGR